MRDTPGTESVREDDERELIGRIVNGARDEFRVLVDRYRDRVFALVMRQVADRSAADEITQESFVRAYLHLSRFDFRSRFSSWLTRIALNRVASYYGSPAFRAGKRAAPFEVDRHDRADESAPDPAALSQLRAALAALPRDLRELIVLCGIEGRSYEEAAEITATPLGTVRSRLNRARLALRDELKRLEGESV